ncbi:hypothetical protein MP638_003637 [Amoeboaphelidium occidentale]|nr:hypothetical protein MP638_003637 [Amoeboaphelidium occidentale]
MPKRKKKKEPEMAFSTVIPSLESATVVSIDAADVARVNDESPEETSTKRCKSCVNMRSVDASYEYATSTIKFGLLKNVKSQDFQMKLKRYVERMNLIRIHASNLFNLYLIDMLAAGKSIGLVTTGKDGTLLEGDLERIVSDYASMLKQVGFELPNGDGLSQSMVHLAGEYETRCKTFVSTTLLGRIARWLKFLLETALPEVFVSMARSKSAAGYLIAMFIYEMSDDPKKTRTNVGQETLEQVYCVLKQKNSGHKAESRKVKDQDELAPLLDATLQNFGLL